MLVTGGAGFIGSHYVRSVLGEAWDLPQPDAVVVLDKLTYAGNIANLDPVRDDARLRFVRGDILDASLVDGLIAEADVVVHFAAESHVDRSIELGRDFVETNVVGTQTLLDAVVRHRRGALRPRLDRRGLRVDRTRLMDRVRAAVAELALLGVQGVFGSDGACLLSHPRGPGVHHSLLEQLRALPVSPRRSSHCS